MDAACNTRIDRLALPPPIRAVPDCAHLCDGELVRHCHEELRVGVDFHGARCTDLGDDAVHCHGGHLVWDGAGVLVDAEVLPGSVGGDVSCWMDEGNGGTGRERT